MIVSAEDFQAMIGLYTSGATRPQVAERFGVSVSSMKRVQHETSATRPRSPQEQRPQGRDQHVSKV